MPPGWSATRSRILERDNYQCKVIKDDGQLCNDQATTVDHIVAAADGGVEGDSNLRAACEACNHRLGSRLGGGRRFF
jgi:5-methylcytosine-specific restriction endonuclease McrA